MQEDLLWALGCAVQFGVVCGFSKVNNYCEPFVTTQPTQSAVTDVLYQVFDYSPSKLEKSDTHVTERTSSSIQSSSRNVQATVRWAKGVDLHVVHDDPLGQGAGVPAWVVRLIRGD